MNYLIIFGAKYLYLVVVTIFLAYFFLSTKERRTGIFIFSLFDLPAVYLVALIGGFFYHNPRPFVSEHITPLISHVADNGFPSDHTLLIAALASIMFCYNRRLGILTFILAILIGLSRVLSGIHHWIDVLGSLVIAVAVTAIVYKLSHKRLYI